MNINKKWYLGAIILIFTIGIALRLVVPDTSRTIIIGDETSYNHAAKNLLKYGTITFDMNGDIFNGVSEVVPSSALQPGYPIYISIIYMLFGESTKTVLISQVILSIFSLWLIFRTLELLKLRKPYIVISLAIAAVYPAFIYNIDRMLTETLFTTLLLLFSYLFLRSLQTNNFILLGGSGIVLACATHVRALAFPFIVVVIFILIIYEKQNKKNLIKNLTVFVGMVILFMLPWWIRNIVTFDRFMLFTEAGEGPKIWGAVPYFIDMGSTSNLSLEEITTNNSTPSPSTYYKWRLFGFFQYMWGDLWDEYLVHPFKFFRPLIVLQQFVIIPCIIAIPFIIKKCRKEILFISCFPIAFTLMNMPFHGLPRYVYPSIPFVIMIVGVILEKIVDKFKNREASSTDKFLFKWQSIIDRIFRYVYIVVASIFAIVLFYSVYIFAYNINTEMSEYRLNKYIGTSIESLKSNEAVSSVVYSVDQLVVENSVPKNKETFKTNPEAPSIIKLQSEILNSGSVVSEVKLNIRGGYAHDYMTVYWTGQKTNEITENSVYRFPINRLEKSHTIYIDDDINFLMIVPSVFRGGSFTIDSIEVRKYNVQ